MCFKTIFLFLKVVVFCVCAIGVTRKWSSLNLIFLCSSIHFCNFCNHLISSKKKKVYLCVLIFVPFVSIFLLFILLLLTFRTTYAIVRRLPRHCCRCNFVVITNDDNANSHGGSKTRALSYLRDTPAEANVPITIEGELIIKITLIDGRKSTDRAWRTVTAEVRGTKLKMTIYREGKSNQVSISTLLLLLLLFLFFPTCKIHVLFPT